MSLLTRCPACETLYKLVPDQLRISQGWVKCGQCSQIFDASQHLIQIASAAEMPPVVVAPPHSTGPDEVAQDEQPLQPDIPVLATPGAVAAPQDAAQEVSCAVADVLAVIPEPAAQATTPAPETNPESVWPTTQAQDEPTPVSSEAAQAADVMSQNPPAQAVLGAAEAEASQAGGESNTLAVAEPALAPEAVSDQVSFLTAHRPRSVWLTRLGHLGLGLAAFLLALGLLLQWLYWERDRLAATYPQWKPFLQQFCQPLNCQLNALQHIDSIIIDAAAFHKLEDATYRLSFTVKNQSQLPLALPAIELTLTDTQDQVIIRRILLQQALFANADDLLAGSVRPASLVVRIDTQDNAMRVMGYRLLAFYP